MTLEWLIQALFQFPCLVVNLEWNHSFDWLSNPGSWTDVIHKVTIEGSLKDLTKHKYPNFLKILRLQGTFQEEISITRGECNKWKKYINIRWSKHYKPSCNRTYCIVFLILVKQLKPLYFDLHAEYPKCLKKFDH